MLTYPHYSCESQPADFVPLLAKSLDCHPSTKHELTQHGAEKFFYFTLDSRYEGLCSCVVINDSLVSYEYKYNVT